MDEELTYEWNSVSTLPYAYTYGQKGRTLCFVYNDIIHLFIPGSEENSVIHCQWDGTSWTYTTTTDYNLLDMIYGTVVVFNNTVYLFNGYMYSWDGTGWTLVGKIPNSENAMQDQLVVVYNNELHVIGGTGYGDYLYASNKHYKWDGSSTDTLGEPDWQELSDLPIGISSDTYSAVVYNNEIHLIGGTATEIPADPNDLVEFTSNHYKYNAEDGWEQVNDQSSIYNAAGMGLVVYNNTLHLLGGFNNGEDILTHYKWNGSAWEADEGLPFPAYNNSILFYNDTINIIGSPDSQSANKHYALSVVENVEPVNPNSQPGYNQNLFVDPDPVRFKKILGTDFINIIPDPNTIYRVITLNENDNTFYQDIYIGNEQINNDTPSAGTLPEGATYATNSEIRQIIGGTYKNDYETDNVNYDPENQAEADDEDIQDILNGLFI